MNQRPKRITVEINLRNPENMGGNIWHYKICAVDICTGREAGAIGFFVGTGTPFELTGMSMIIKPEYRGYKLSEALYLALLSFTQGFTLGGKIAESNYRSRDLHTKIGFVEHADLQFTRTNLIAPGMTPKPLTTKSFKAQRMYLELTTKRSRLGLIDTERAKEQSNPPIQQELF